MFSSIVISFLFIPACMYAPCRADDQLQQQHFQLLRNQMKIINGMRQTSQVEFEKRINNTIEGLERRLNQLEQQRPPSHATGATFTRWGRKDCPTGTSRLLYSGSVGGSYYDHTGGATTYLCLPSNPQRLQNLPYTHAYLYGGEYDVDNVFGKGLKNGDDIPCAVCQSKTGSQKMMIPARIECLPGWTKQYAGYLGTEHHVHKSSKEYICMDEKPQAAHKGHHNYNGALVYSVKAVCGSLPCPPFKNGDTVTCVVCTK